MNINIVGYYNPYGEYPSRVIPVFRDNKKKLSLWYILNNDASIQHLSKSADYIKLKEPFISFDAYKEFIFVFDKDNAVRVDIENQQSFFFNCFQEGVFDDSNPFLAVSYAISSADIKIITRILRTCILELKTNSLEYAKKWYSEILASPDLYHLKKEFPENPLELLINKPTLRIGGLPDLSMAIKRIARILNNGILDMSDQYFWIEPSTSENYCISNKELHKEIDILISGFSEFSETPDFNSYINPLRSVDVGESSLVLAIDPKSRFAKKIKSTNKLHQLLSLAENSDDLKWLQPDIGISDIGKLIDKRINFTLNKYSISYSSIKNAQYYKKISDAYKKAIVCGDWNISLLIGLEHAILSEFSSLPFYLQPKVIKLKNGDLRIKFKGILLNPAVLSLSSFFNQFEEYLSLSGVLKSLAKSGIYRISSSDSLFEYTRSAGVSDITIPYRNRIFYGKYAIYKKIVGISEWNYAETILATVVKVIKDPLTKSVPLLSEGEKVVIKYPRPLSNGFSSFQKKELLDLVNNSFRKQYVSLTRLIDNKNVASTYDDGDFILKRKGVEYTSHFIVNQYIDEKVDGIKLSNRINSPISSIVFFDIARKLTDALRSIHQAGVVHGNISPNNIFIDSHSNPIFVDFGQIILRSEIPPKYYRADNPLYISPEKDYSVEADIYSLCATLYFIATRQDPPNKEKNSLVVKINIVNDLKKYNPSLYKENSGIADIIARGLRFYKKDRTSNTQKLMEDIDLFNPKEVSPTDQSMALKEIDSNISTFLVKDPLFACFANAKLEELKYHVRGMNEGNYDVLGSHDEIVMAMSKFMSYCKKDDEYLTASIPWLWYTGNMGINGRLLTINKEVIKQGIVLRRVFIITDDDLNHPQTIDVLNAHNDMMRDIERDYVMLNTRDSDLAKKGGYTGVLHISNIERRKIFDDYPHSGTWFSYTAKGNKQNKQQIVKVIQPFYDEEKKILTGVRLKRKNEDPTALKTIFIRRLMSDSIEIGVFLEKLRSNVNVFAVADRLLD
jgi:serine/threonine protein kinase